MLSRARIEAQPVFRTYGQYCPIARGMDVLGDRWVLLIMQELVSGPRRFTDIRQALIGLAPNLLTRRLRDLQARGLVESVEVAGRGVYRATQSGLKVVPVLDEIGRFGYLFVPGHRMRNENRVTSPVNGRAAPGPGARFDQNNSRQESGNTK